MFSSRFKWSLQTNAQARLLAEKQRAGVPVLDLTAANPTRAGFSYPTAEILNSFNDHRAMRYEPAPQGLPSVRSAIAAYYRERGESVAPESICLTASTSEAYSWLFKLLADPGDAVLVPQPGYPLFDFLAALEGIELRPYELSYTHPAGWSLDFDSLHQALTPRTRAVIIVSPNNPTGSFVTPPEAEYLTEFCAANHLALIVDEVFADYALDPETTRATPFTGISSALTFVMNGLSKTLGLPQMKLGWIITSGPEELQREALSRLELIADTFLSVNTPVQQAASAWLRLRQPIQQQILERVRDNYDWLEKLTQDSPCRLLRVGGGWTAPLEIPRYYSEEAWTMRLLAEDNLLAHPGYFFDFPREAFLVLSLLTPTMEFREATQRMMTSINNH